jgi:hypothetical protein
MNGAGFGDPAGRSEPTAMKVRDPIVDGRFASRPLQRQPEDPHITWIPERFS